MRRWLSSLASALSLILCAAIIALWARSYRASDFVSWRHLIATENNRGNFYKYREIEIRTGTGKMDFYWDTHWFDDPAAQPVILYGEEEPPLPFSTGTRSFWNRLGFRIVAGKSAGIAILPLWLPTLLATCLPLLWLAVAVGQRRPRVAGLCFRCGYDLRASRERCPECGTPVDPRPIGSA